LSRESPLEPRTVLITGGSRGIGYATAEAFVAAGARVAICAQDPARLEQAARALARRGEVLARAADVRSYKAMHMLVQEVLERWGRIDVLVNNAGRAWAGMFAMQAPEGIEADLDVNVKGVLLGTRAVLPHMLERASGIIVNLSSGAGQVGFAGLATYCASKFAVLGFTEALAREVGPAGVRVYAVCPGRVATDMQVQVSGRRIGVPPARVAAAIVKLAGPNPPIAPGGCVEIYEA
jgi:3-oxoacyl-[acyl-carrier protein] reductase